MYAWDTVGETNFSFSSDWVVNLEIVSGLKWDSWQLSLSVLELLFDSKLCKTCECRLGLPEFICTSVLLCLEGIVCSASSIPPALIIMLPLQHSSLIPERRGLRETSHLVLGVSRTLTLCPLSSHGSLYCFPLTEEEASLMVSEWDSDHQTVDIAECHEESFYFDIYLTE